MTSTRKKATAKKTRKELVLSTCPIGGAGWCAYPFSVTKLEKRLKAKSAKAEKQPVLAGARSR